MIELAKKAVENYVRDNRKNKAPDDLPEKLTKNLACFVTLTKQNNLRGCIGTLEPQGRLCDSIIENAISAATRDYRFNTVQENELPGLEYEISVLTEPARINYVDFPELFVKIKNKGVIIDKSGSRAVYLPQVWEHFNSETAFLSSLCLKAGFDGNAWKSKEVGFFVFDIYK